MNELALPAEIMSSSEAIPLRAGGKRMANLEGQTLGKYRVLEALGRGGMARVYRAYHSNLDRYVAIKVMRSDLADDEEFLARFQREARAVASLRHPNIVQVFDFEVEDDVYYMVMELLEGDSLKTRLNDYRVRDEKMELGEVVRIMLDVLDGLGYAHSEGMTHRDIKPANILLTRRGQAVVADFGIAHIVGGTRYTASGMLIGTLEYIAPEQGLEGQSDARSDIYSLGIVLYEILTQRTPFDADTPLAILMKHVNDPLPLPRRIDPKIPEPFERVVLKALAKKPEDRYQSAAEMADALRKAAEAAGVTLPGRISLPLSFSTDDAPAESVAVFSGNTRSKLRDVDFAGDDTATSLAKSFETAKLDEEEVLDRAQGKKKRPRWRRARERPAQETVKRRRAVGRSISGALLIVLLGNLIMVSYAAPTNNWGIYERGWPIEILLATLGLCLIMYATSSIWMLISTGPVMVTGVLLAYSSLTGKWAHWNFLWLFEVWGVIASVVIPILVARQKDVARGAARFLAVLFGLVAIVWIAIVGFGSTVIPVYFRFLRNLFG